MRIKSTGGAATVVVSGVVVEPARVVVKVTAGGVGFINDMTPLVALLV